MSYCSSLSSTRNSIYSIHSSYYSVSLSGSITSFSIILLFFFFQQVSMLLVMFLIGVTNLIVFSALLSPRINDPTIENEFGFTRTEQFSAMVSIKLLILSELMLFFARFRGLINARFISNAFSLFFCFPLFSSYSFAIPYSNVIVLLFLVNITKSYQSHFSIELLVLFLAFDLPEPTSSFALFCLFMRGSTLAHFMHSCRQALKLSLLR